jgi:hypothetical protein
MCIYLETVEAEKRREEGRREDNGRKPAGLPCPEKSEA